MLDRSTTAEADASTSTIRTTDVTPIPQSRPMRVPDPVQPVRAEQGRIEPRTGGEVGGRPQLVVTCPLCLEDAMALTSTLCGHVFCKEVCLAVFTPFLGPYLNPLVYHSRYQPQAGVSRLSRVYSHQKPAFHFLERYLMNDSLPSFMFMSIVFLKNL